MTSAYQTLIQSPPDIHLAAAISTLILLASLRARKQALTHPISDEIELRLALLEVTVDHRRLLAFATTLTHKSRKSVGVADAGWLLDRSGHVVVVVAEFESQQLDLVWGLPDCIVQHGETSRHCHTLPSSHGHQVEFVSVAVRDGLVNDGACGGVLEAVGIAGEDACVDSLTAVDVHQLASLRDTMCGKGLLDLLNLGDTDALYLALADTIAVENDLRRRRSIVALEGLNGTCHAGLQVG